jgi:hypothetical protein
MPKIPTSTIDDAGFGKPLSDERREPNRIDEPSPDRLEPVRENRPDDGPAPATTAPADTRPLFSRAIDATEFAPARSDSPKRRGRKPGSINKPREPEIEAKTPIHIDTIENLLFSIHLTLASMSGIDELAINKDEAQSFAIALAEVGKQYSVVLYPKKLALINLAGIAGMIYVPRVVAIVKNHTRPPAPVIAGRPQAVARPTAAVAEMPRAMAGGAPAPADVPRPGQAAFSATPVETRPVPVNVPRGAAGDLPVDTNTLLRSAIQHGATPSMLYNQPPDPAPQDMNM